jgi:hypothetical protein
MQTQAPCHQAHPWGHHNNHQNLKHRVMHLATKDQTSGHAPGPQGEGEGPHQEPIVQIQQQAQAIQVQPQTLPKEEVA